MLADESKAIEAGLTEVLGDADPDDADAIARRAKLRGIIEAFGSKLISSAFDHAGKGSAGRPCG